MAMAEKRNIEFGVEGGVTLRGWLFVPGAKGPAPAITMAHGYAGVKEHGLERFARAFSEAGFVVLVHDHRHFGASDGAERGDVDPWQQIADWRRAISFLESRPEVDAAQIGIWGTSYAGGHAIVLGATDRRLKAVVAQVPTISGFEQGLRRVAPDGIAALERAFAEDDRGQLRGEPFAFLLMLTSRGPGQRASYIARSTRPNGRPSTRYRSASAAFARLVVLETACLASNVLASWATALPIEPPMAGARTVFPS